MDLEQVKGFAAANSRALSETNKLARCVDGRYENIDDMPLLAKPGADAGDLMIAFGALNDLKLSLPNERVLQTVLDVVGGAANFRFHTDDHAGEVPGMGCGHIKQAKLDPIAYGLEQSQIDYIYDELPRLLDQGAEQITLHGDHAEQAVIVVDSETHGLVPLVRTDEGLQEAFIYQQTLHQGQLRTLVRLLHEASVEAGHTVEEQQVSVSATNVFAKQLGQTLDRLAKGLPIYNVHINSSGQAEVKE